MSRGGRVRLGRLEVLWAPWRLAYVQRPKARRCLFCAAASARRDRVRYIVGRSRSAFVILNRFPYANGHVMVAPYRHVGGFDRLTAVERVDLVDLLGACQRLLQDALQPDGFNVGVNLGRVAGAGVAGHLHLHVVPRWQGDTNFMPTVAATKVIPQSLETLYDVLAEAWGRRGERVAARRTAVGRAQPRRGRRGR